MWNRAKDKVNKKLTIHVVRHGKTRLNEEHRYQGIIDEGLSENGVEGLHNLLNHIEYPKSAVIFVSPMKRAIETAHVLYGEQIQLINVDEFKELSFGDFEGKNYNELKDIKEYREWINACVKMQKTNDMRCLDVINLPESVSDFVSRVKKGLEKVANKCDELNVTEAVIVAHGGTIMAISKILGEGYYTHNVACGEYVTFCYGDENTLGL